MTTKEPASLRDEMRRILAIAVSLANLHDQDFEVLRATADICLPWADEVAAEIRAILEANEETRVYADTYLGGDPAGWYRNLFSTSDLKTFWFHQMNLAVEHVRHDVPNEVVVGLAPRWINILAQRAQKHLPPEQALAFTQAMPRILSGTVTVMVATHEMVMMRTFMQETGFSKALVKRLQQNTLKTFAEQMMEEQRKCQEENDAAAKT